MNKKNFLAAFLTLILLQAACSFTSTAPIGAPASVTSTIAQPISIPVDTQTLTLVSPTETITPLPPTETSTPTAIPIVESLKAKVTADLLSCRYGPGPEYLYLIAFNKSTPLRLLGRTSGISNWVLVQNSPQKCWVKTNFLEIDGDPQTLQVMYPAGYKLPVSPYYSSPVVLSAVRDPNNSSKITVNWTDISLRAGDEEDESMFIYIIEVWRCEGGKIIFDPLAANYPEITFVDEAGCDIPSHGRVFFQEKHGFAGPAEIPWPAQ